MLLSLLSLLSACAVFAVTEIIVCLHLQLFDTCGERDDVENVQLCCALLYYSYWWKLRSARCVCVYVCSVLCDMYENNYVIHQFGWSMHYSMRTQRHSAIEWNWLLSSRKAFKRPTIHSHSRTNAHTYEQAIVSIKVKCICEGRFFSRFYSVAFKLLAAASGYFCVYAWSVLCNSRIKINWRD